MNRNYRELEITTSCECIGKVENFVDEICEAYYITNSYYGNISVAIMEAVRNAMIHGNRNNPGKLVLITFTGIPNGIQIMER